MRINIHGENKRSSTHSLEQLISSDCVDNPLTGEECHDAGRDLSTQGSRNQLTDQLSIGSFIIEVDILKVGVEIAADYSAVRFGCKEAIILVFTNQC